MICNIYILKLTVLVSSEYGLPDLETGIVVEIFKRDGGDSSSNSRCYVLARVSDKVLHCKEFRCLNGILLVDLEMPIVTQCELQLGMV